MSEIMEVPFPLAFCRLLISFFTFQISTFLSDVVSSLGADMMVNYLGNYLDEEEDLPLEAKPLEVKTAWAKKTVLPRVQCGSGERGGGKEKGSERRDAGLRLFGAGDVAVGS